MLHQTPRNTKNPFGTQADNETIDEGLIAVGLALASKNLEKTKKKQKTKKQSWKTKVGGFLNSPRLMPRDPNVPDKKQRFACGLPMSTSAAIGNTFVRCCLVSRKSGADFRRALQTLGRTCQDKKIFEKTKKHKKQKKH
jgi:hypothetical protein